MSQYEPSGPYQQYPPYQPYPPYPLDRPPPPWEGPRPAAIRYARNLICTCLALGLVRLVLWMFDEHHSEVPEPLADHGAEGPPTAVLAAIGVMSTVIGIAVWVVAVMFIMRAANWARIMVVVLCASAAVGLLWSLVSYGLIEPEHRPATDLMVIDVVTTVLLATATVLLWTPESSRYFKSGGPPS